MELTVLRHSTARKIDDTGYFADLEQRTLTEEGVGLAIQRRRKLNGSTYDLVLASPAVRTVQTAGIVAGLGRENIHDVVLVEELCYGDPKKGGDAKTLDQLFRELEYAPLADYLGKGTDGEALNRIGTAEWHAVRSRAERAHAETVLAVGHAVLVNALGYEAVSDAVSRVKLANTSFGECEGFVLTFDKDYQVVGLRLLQ